MVDEPKEIFIQLMEAPSIVVEKVEEENTQDDESNEET